MSEIEALRWVEQFQRTHERCVFTFQREAPFWRVYLETWDRPGELSQPKFETRGPNLCHALVELRRVIEANVTPEWRRIYTYDYDG